VRKRVVRLALSTLLLTLSFRAEAQQPEKVFRIGVLVAPSASYISYRVGAFRQRLSELGYVEGKNVVTDFRYAEGKVDRLPALAAELVRLEVNAIVTAEPSVTRPAKEATAVIPIVMTNDSDPVGAGFVDSLARPGGNVTGLTGLARELSGTRLELLKEIFPKLSRVAIVEMSDIPGNGQAVKDTEIAAAAMKIQTQYIDIRTPNDIEPAFSAASKGRADAVSVLNGPPTLSG
jgi:putative ABC transport system substrate-binding protein